MSQRLHDDEVDIDVGLARQLVASQFPQYRDLPVVPVSTSGTSNVIFRLGDELAIRLPRTSHNAASLANERDALRQVRGHLPLPVPTPVGIGEASATYPLPWAIFGWIDGEPWSLSNPPAEEDAAIRLARFVGALQAIDPASGNPSRRDTRLAERDEAARSAIREIHEFEAGELEAAWRQCRDLPDAGDRRVWTHADLLSSNVLTEHGKLAAVIDFGLAGVGDPALDLTPAWTLFTTAGRAAFRHSTGASDADWARGRGYALFQALLIIPYYRESNPSFAAGAHHTVREILAEM